MLENAPSIAGLAGLQIPTAPAPAAFVWGSGGRRMTPEEVAAERQQAQQLSAAGMDYSPVGSWTQGAARVAQGLLGGIEARRADRAADANTAESQSVAQLLMGDGSQAPSGSTVAAALVNPYLDPTTRQLAVREYERMNPKPLQPTEFERMLAAGGIMPGTPEFIDANRRAAMAKADPFTVIQTKAGTLAGPQSLVRQAMGGGAAPIAEPPPEAIAELRADPSGAAEFDEVFGPGAAARYLGGPAVTPPATFP